jgi:hypothetical protein
MTVKSPTSEISSSPIYWLVPKNAKDPLFYSDTTIEALLHKLATEWPSAFLRSSEASLIMTGRAVKNLAFLNELWGLGHWK